MSTISPDVWKEAKAIRDEWLFADPEGDSAVMHAIALGIVSERKRRATAKKNIKVALDEFQRSYDMGFRTSAGQELRATLKALEG